MTDRQTCALKQIDVPVYVYAIQWVSNRSWKILVCNSHKETEQNFCKAAQERCSCFLASCTESPALRAGEGTTAKIIHREASSRELSSCQD